MLDERDIQAIAQLLKPLENKIDGLEVRMDRLEARMDKLEEKVDRLEVRMDRLEARMDKLEEKVDRLEVRMDGLETRMDSLETRMDSLEEEMDVLRKQVTRNTLVVENIVDKCVTVLNEGYQMTFEKVDRLNPDKLKSQTNRAEVLAEMAMERVKQLSDKTA